MRTTSSFRIDREGYDHCEQLLRAAGIEFIEERRTKSYLGPNRIEALIIHGTLNSERSSLSCRLRLCGRHYRLDVIADWSNEMVGDISKALGKHRICPD